jgi:hypothetical protein
VKLPRLATRLIPVALAFGAVTLLDDVYGRHPVDLIVALPGERRVRVTEPLPFLNIRIQKPDGKLVLGLSANGAEGTQTVVIHTKLPRGKFHVDGWITGDPKKLSAELDYHGEDAVEVALTE